MDANEYVNKYIDFKEIEEAHYAEADFNYVAQKLRTHTSWVNNTQVLYTMFIIDIASQLSTRVRAFPEFKFKVYDHSIHSDFDLFYHGLNTDNEPRDFVWAVLNMETDFTFAKIIPVFDDNTRKLIDKYTEICAKFDTWTLITKISALLTMLDYPNNEFNPFKIIYFLNNITSLDKFLDL